MISDVTVTSKMLPASGSLEGFDDWNFFICIVLSNIFLCRTQSNNDPLGETLYSWGVEQADCQIRGFTWNSANVVQRIICWTISFNAMSMGRGRIRNDFIKTTYTIEEKTAHLTISTIIVEVVGWGEEVDLTLIQMWLVWLWGVH